MTHISSCHTYTYAESEESLKLQIWAQARLTLHLLTTGFTVDVIIRSKPLCWTKANNHNSVKSNEGHNIWQARYVYFSQWSKNNNPGKEQKKILEIQTAISRINPDWLSLIIEVMDSSVAHYLKLLVRSDCLKRNGNVSTFSWFCWKVGLLKAFNN